MPQGEVGGRRCCCLLDRVGGMEVTVLPNWLAHTEAQLKAAASRRVLRSGGLQRWTS